MFPKAMRRFIMMALRGSLLQVLHPIYWPVPTYIRAKAFDIETIGAGLDAIKRRMVAWKNNETLMWKLTSITLEIVVKCGNGFKFGKLDLYRSDATGFPHRWGYPHSAI